MEDVMPELIKLGKFVSVVKQFGKTIVFEYYVEVKK
jgi:hypothetical protein